MTTTSTLTLHATIPIEGGTITVALDAAPLPLDPLAATVLARIIDQAGALADRIDHPTGTAPQRITDLAGTAERAPVVEAAPRGTSRGPKAKPGRATGPGTGPHARGSIAAPGTTMRAILDTIADHGGRWEGTSQTLGVKAGSTPASGPKLIRTLATAGLVTIEHAEPRTVTAIALTGDGWRHLDRPKPTDGALPRLVLTEPTPDPVEDRAPAIDLATLPREGSHLDHDRARARAAGAL